MRKLLGNGLLVLASFVVSVLVAEVELRLVATWLPFELHPEEIERGGWFAPEEVSQWMAQRPQDFASALLAIWPIILQSHPASA